MQDGQALRLYRDCFEPRKILEQIGLGRLLVIFAYSSLFYFIYIIII
ncbi:hypothetical protein cco76_01774 [Campylobacter coli LMG 23336]|nr:hypothetical protein cco111_07061 [Campylobacter coli 2680]EIA97576.1 hypothetical protein cco76_01774 [Campylobacter coli LMG 23336]